MSLDLVLVRQFLEAVAPLVGGVSVVSKDGFVVCGVGVVCGQECLKESEFALRPFSIFACSHGVRHLAVPVMVDGVRWGVFVLSCGEVSRDVEVAGVRLGEFLSSFRTKENNGIDERPNDAGFLQALLLANDVAGVCDVASSYLMHVLRLSNCSLVLDGLRGRYNKCRQLEPVLSRVEDVLVGQLVQARASFIIRNLADDVVTKGIEGVGLVPWSVAAFPLVHDRRFLGGLLLFFEKEVDIGLLGVLCGQLSLALAVVQRFVRASEGAKTDVLTGLPNRGALMEALGVYLPDAWERGLTTSLAVVDLDDFKIFNDTRGHLAGDELLQKLAKLMTDVLQKHRVCRYGGEEFVVLFEGVGQQESRLLMERLVNDCRERLEVTMSVGLVSCLKSSLGGVELVREADKALYQAKRRGKDRVCQVVVVDKNLGVIDVEEAASMGKYG